MDKCVSENRARKVPEVSTWTCFPAPCPGMGLDWDNFVDQGTRAQLYVMLSIYVSLPVADGVGMWRYI